MDRPPHIGSLQQLHHELQMTKPSLRRCRALGLHDVEDVESQYYGYCVLRFIDKPFSRGILAAIARWYPSSYYRRQKRERSRMHDAGRIVPPDRFRGRARKTLSRAEEFVR